MIHISGEMKNKSKILNWFKPRNWGWVKVWRDFENYLDWVRTIKKEKANPLSLYNKWKLEHTKLYDVYVIVSLEDADSILPEALQRVKVIEQLNPLNKYLDELLFAECLDVEFNQFEDENSKLTLTYLIVYSFRWNKFNLKWLLKFIIITSVLLYLILHFNIIPWVIKLL